MILYFSGTGNSRYVAEVIQTITKDELISINELLKNKDCEKIKSSEPLVFVCPTYAWRIPRVIEEFIRKTEFSGSNKAYFVLTCGDGVGSAVHYAKKLCHEKRLDFKGLDRVVMPDNYIAMFQVPDSTQANKIIRNAKSTIVNIANCIKDGECLLTEKSTVTGKVMSGIVNTIFYKGFISAKGFYSTDKCISCEKCAKLCPLNNIKIENGRPNWGDNCTHCMACICGCPTEAIEYKNKSKGKPRNYNTITPH